MTKCCKQPKKS